MSSMADRLKYYMDRSTSLQWRLKDAEARADAAKQEVDSLRSQLGLVIEPNDAPLWRRIANQRRALRQEMFWRDFWMNTHYATIEEKRVLTWENMELKKKLKELSDEH